VCGVQERQPLFKGRQGKKFIYQLGSYLIAFGDEDVAYLATGVRAFLT
jgi:hypothetical protein